MVDREQPKLATAPRSSHANRRRRAVAAEAEAQVNGIRKSLDDIMIHESGPATGTSQLSEEATTGILRGLHAARGFSRQLKYSRHTESGLNQQHELVSDAVDE